jgi:hypothetical protein
MRDALHRIEPWRGRGAIGLRQAFDLLDVERDVGFEERIVSSVSSPLSMQSVPMKVEA